MWKVQVLMSTYNGEKYLREQIDSILAQKTKLGEKQIEISLLVRDDGSQDGTVGILEEYCKKDPRVSYIKGKNMGACKSFFELMKQAGGEMDYIAFSDQDDIWNKNKIRRAVSGLGRYEDIPALYAGDLEIVDEKLNILKISENTSKNFHPSFGNSLIENICTGCTIVINKKLYQMVVKTIPEHAYMHDWWLYMTASCFGHVIYDPVPFIFYRQHEHNVIGMKKSRLERLWEKILHFSQARNVISSQLKEFYKIYHPQGTNGKLLKRFLYAKKHPSERIRLFRERKIYRQEKFNHLICKILILTGSM
jgi:glycosyltransferase involved in cell wall biosynthesis